MSAVNSTLPPVVGNPRGASAIEPTRSLENPALAQPVAKPALSGRAQMVHILTPVSAGGLGGSVGYKGPKDSVTRQITRIEDLPSEAELAQASGDTTQMEDQINQHKAAIAASSAAIQSLTKARNSIVLPDKAASAGPTVADYNSMQQAMQKQLEASRESADQAMADLKRQLDAANSEKEQARQELAKIEEELAASASLPKANISTGSKTAK